MSRGLRKQGDGFCKWDLSEIRQSSNMRSNKRARADRIFSAKPCKNNQTRFSAGQPTVEEITGHGRYLDLGTDTVPMKHLVEESWTFSNSLKMALPCFPFPAVILQQVEQFKPECCPAPTWVLYHEPRLGGWQGNFKINSMFSVS